MRVDFTFTPAQQKLIIRGLDAYAQEQTLAAGRLDPKSVAAKVLLKEARGARQINRTISYSFEEAEQG